MTQASIGPGARVTLHFSLELEDGRAVDSTREGQPATFEVGDGNLLPGFEQALFGLQSGDKRRLRILPEQGFGQPNPSNVQWVGRDRFNGMELEPGLVISFADGARGELPGVVKSLHEEQVEVDFNHPLAGHTLYFEVEIFAVESVS
ncbi:peptidylprolyl isomerase [Motiliproteus sp. SC1-56]|uniref:FKBP-type peptidyl-prolyl cis-trans isomerase n=1 Tax=Motiliproteus sp. SC1-56 TaxID=2799565 RepID=UPI001A8EF97A|nr:peptidylprolyl isomerase [Motiliproteus sp. SC1-56]